MASWPVRFSVMTYNLWNEQRWQDRRPALEAFFARCEPDILGLQELRAEPRAFLDAALPRHRRVDDPFEGWTVEGNLYWRDDLFDELASGAEPIGHYEKLRRLFWVRLRPRGSDVTMLVAAVHFTWRGNPQERDGGPNLRMPQASETARALDRLRAGDEAVILMGDLNDEGHPIRILRREGSLETIWERLARMPAPTWPAMVCAEAAQTIDWILFKGALRPLSIDVIDFFHGDLPPSDHRPVQAVFELE